MLHIRCKNTGRTVAVAEGSMLLDIFPQLGLPMRPVSAKVNNVSQGLKFRVYQNRDIEYLDLSTTSGMRVYVRSLCFVLHKAVEDTFPGAKLYIEHPLSGGYYCNFLIKRNQSQACLCSGEREGSRQNDNFLIKRNQSQACLCSGEREGSRQNDNFLKQGTRGLTPGAVERIRRRMAEIIEGDMPFHRREVPTEEAIALFRERGLIDKARLLETSGQVYTYYYTLGETVDYYYGPLVPTTAYLGVFGLEPYREGMILRVPDRTEPQRLAAMLPQPMTFEAYKEQVRWNVIMRLSNAGDVNKACQAGRGTELIQVSEALQEKKIVKIAEEIERRHNEHGLRLVLITGPSSSGKTTFCKRLSVQLLACGLRPLSFSTDDYFVNRVDTPLLPNGQYDFDNFDTVDHRLLGEHLALLMQGREVEVPVYNFTTGQREWQGKRLRLTAGHILIIEGIHALNPRLTAGVDDALKYKIFTSALTSVSLDDHNWIPTSDNRLLRRIIRDYNKGAFTARETIQQWPSVCDAERQWILPYQENADTMFNSALNIEFAVLRNHAETILATVPKNCPEYSEAHRLLRFIHYFLPIPDKEIPPTSIMREFLGGSSFKY